MFLFSLPVIADVQTSQVADNKVKTLTVPIAVFIVDAADGDRTLSSQRSVARMDDHFQKVNRVWSQAGIKFEPVTVKRLNAPQDLLRGLIHRRGRGGIADFFRAVRRGDIDMGTINNRAKIWTFYVRSLGGPNGLKPQGRSSIFIVDNPLNEGFRVTSHELGHVLGLYHARDDARKLLFQGTNGLILNRAEKTVARYYAERLAR